MGPEAMRVAGLLEALRRRGIEVVDAGNLQGPSNPLSLPHRGYRHLEEVAAWNGEVFRSVRRALGQSMLPILLGGDHSLAIGSIAAVAEHCRVQQRRLRVLWFDAHADFNTPDVSPSGNIHGMPLAFLFGLGPASALDGLAQRPVLAREQLVQIGVRSVDAGERATLKRLGIEVVDMRLIDEIGMRSAMELALADLDGDTHLHVSLDVDFLDSDLAPGVGTAVPGGPTYREAQLCMEMIADTRMMGSLDIVELNPAMDQRNRTALLAVDLVESLFGKSTLIRAELNPRHSGHRDTHHIPVATTGRGSAAR
jgi:arginase